MDSNVFKPPEAQLTDANTQEIKFYIVSPQKFLILYLTTFGFYEIYWFYKNWSIYKQATSSSLWPVPRAIFPLFFIHELFSKVKHELLVRNIDREWKHQFSASLFVFFFIFGWVNDNILEEAVGLVASFIITFFILFTTAWILYQAQISINLACDSKGGAENSNITLYNVFWIILGLAFWGLMLLTVASLYYPNILPEF